MLQKRLINTLQKRETIQLVQITLKYAKCGEINFSLQPFPLNSVTQARLSKVADVGLVLNINNVRTKWDYSYPEVNIGRSYRTAPF